MRTIRTQAKEEGKKILDDLQIQHEIAIRNQRSSGDLKAVGEILNNNALKEFMRNEGYIIERRRDLPLLIRYYPSKAAQRKTARLSVTDLVKRWAQTVDVQDSTRTTPKTIQKKLPEHASE